MNISGNPNGYCLFAFLLVLLIVFVVAFVVLSIALNLISTINHEVSVIEHALNATLGLS